MPKSVTLLSDVTNCCKVLCPRVVTMTSAFKRVRVSYMANKKSVFIWSLTLNSGHGVFQRHMYLTVVCKPTLSPSFPAYIFDSGGDGSRNWSHFPPDRGPRPHPQPSSDGEQHTYVIPTTICSNGVLLMHRLFTYAVLFTFSSSVTYLFTWAFPMWKSSGNVMLYFLNDSA